MAKSKFWNGSAWEVLGTDADKITETTDHKVMTAAERTKLSGIAAGAQVNVPTNIAQGTRTTTTVPITSSTGTGATLAAATTSLAGVMTAADKTKLDNAAQFKRGSGTFPAGTSYTVNDAFITADTLVTVIPISEKRATWTVESTTGSFTITADSAESNPVTFDWGAVK